MKIKNTLFLALFFSATQLVSMHHPPKLKKDDIDLFKAIKNRSNIIKPLRNGA